MYRRRPGGWSGSDSLPHESNALKGVWLFERGAFMRGRVAHTTAGGSPALRVMFLLILESIGTSELFLIGVVALMFLGPRKLPQMARKIGKLMAEFRATTSEFRSTWEKEVDFAEEEEKLKKDADEMSAQQVARLKDVTPAETPALPDAPAIKQIDESTFKELQAKAQNGNEPPEIPAAPDPEPEQEVKTAPGKQDWL